MMNAISQKSSGLKGKIVIPSDKSISHRALMFGAIAKGTTKISNLLRSEDVMRTLEAMRSLGAAIEEKRDGTVFVSGADRLSEPEHPLDMGNAGTATRLLMGLVSSHPIAVSFFGDASLSKRPMKRVMAPLSKNGAEFKAKDGEFLPLTVIGAASPKPISYTLPVASAQIKSAILLAGLNTKGATTVIEPVPSRDHTELMLKAFGADIAVEKTKNGNIITLKGKASLKASEVSVPADISSAAFAIVAALITRDSEILLENIGVNPLRTGLLDALKMMGADITLLNERIEAGERVADISVRSSALNAIDLPAEIAPRMIDEYPILAVACACASGTSVLRGLDELKVKESNRFQAILDGLSANGILAEASGSDIKITGSGNIKGGGFVKTSLDHRMGMSFLVLGMVSEQPVTIDDRTCMTTSFPDFIDLMNERGAHIT